MRRKRYILEQEEELTDFKKILLINKKKLSYGEVEFYDSNGDDFSNIIEVTQDGLLFTFDGLKEYLQFFFPDDYGQEHSDGEYDAMNYEYMYNRQYDYRNEYWDRASEDWDEGYITGSFKKEHYEILYKIFKIVSPRLYSLINSEKKGEVLDKEIANFLESFPNVSMLLFARFGAPEDNLLDLLFEGIKKTKVSHLPIYYEMMYNYWDQESFNNVFDSEVTSVLEKLYETLLEDESYSKKYLETVDKILQLGGFGIWIPTKDGKYKIKLTDVNKDTLKVTYFISDTTWDMNAKRGITDIDSIYNLLYQQSMWSPKEFREHFLRFLSDSVL